MCNFKDSKWVCTLSPQQRNNLNCKIRWLDSFNLIDLWENKLSLIINEIRYKAHMASDCEKEYMSKCANAASIIKLKADTILFQYITDSWNSIQAKAIS